MTIKELLKRNQYIYSFLSEVMNLIRFLISTTKYQISKFLRVSRINRKSPFEKMKILKDKHKGDRCFIVATGPSLLIEDLDKIKNEITFSMNSIFFAFDETDWRPTYYGIQFPEFFDKYRSYIDHLEVEAKFVGDYIAKQAKLTDDYYIYPLNMLNHNRSKKKYHYNFSADPFKDVYSGHTITYSLMQIAVYMGFEEIYLIGVDCNYPSNTNTHFKDYGIVDPLSSTAGERMICAFKEAKKYADRHKINIYNATRGGMLEVFERVDLDKLFSEEKVI